MATAPIALVSMPSLRDDIPSFQLALLKPTLERAGYTVVPHSVFLHFSSFIGSTLNQALAEVHMSLAGEWIWSRAAFGEVKPSHEYLSRFHHDLVSICEPAGVGPEVLLELRDERCPQFIERLVEDHDWSQYAFVGFTVVFQQMLASLALAKALKRKYPTLPIVFGGATFEDDIAAEVMAHCPFVDVVHCGDADQTLPELARRVAKRLPLDGLPGAMFRGPDGAVRFNGRAPNLEQMDLTPMPDFDEFIALRDDLELERKGALMLPIETARGCWYGMKNHCTFCGLNRQGMAFRSKSPAQVLEMLKHLSRRYGTRHFNAIDNILAPEYAEALFGVLAEAKTDLELHYEIRPTVSRAQLRSMRRGGLISVQPGVESFSTHVLTLMKKFTTGIKNIELLKWTAYFQISNAYNLLYGFPGETVDDATLHAKVIPQLFHYQPPYGMVKARPDRGSPMYEKPTEQKMGTLVPVAVYQHLYPPEFDLQKISYYFDDTRTDVPPRETYDESLALVEEWTERWKDSERPSLTSFKTPGSLSIHDERHGKRVATRFDDRAAELYEFCADARRTVDVVEQFGQDRGWLDATLEEMLEKQLLLELDGRYLALALPVNPHH
ncbi:MAG: RiPP maturation radical SAM C-methyltransferase [Archangium sp.]|nr:RiPP maturation radical SAM C-methyltransferase [Archangium sp.]